MNIVPTELPNKALNPHLYLVDTAFIVNQKYLVYLNTVSHKLGDVLHMRVQRVDKTPILNFDIFTEIKNKLIGKDVTVIHILPATKDVAERDFYHFFACQHFVLPNLNKLYFYTAQKRKENEQA